MAAAPALIDETAQCAEEFRHAVDFVEHDQPVFVLAQEKCGLRELAAIVTRFQVKVQGRDLSAELQRKCGFANLTWADQGDSRLPGDGVFEDSEFAAGDHPCILSMLWKIYKDKDPEYRRLI